MQALLRYDPLSDRGFQDEQSYTVEIKTEEEEIKIYFVFTNMPQGLSKDSKVALLALSFRKEEVENLVAALNGVLHHPEIKDKSVKWENK